MAQSQGFPDKVQERLRVLERELEQLRGRAMALTHVEAPCERLQGLSDDFLFAAAEDFLSKNGPGSFDAKADANAGPPRPTHPEARRGPRRPASLADAEEVAGRRASSRLRQLATRLEAAMKRREAS